MIKNMESVELKKVNIKAPNNLMKLVDGVLVVFKI
jgi:hypothetical protein